MKTRPWSSGMLLAVVGLVPFLLASCSTYTSSFRRPSPLTIPDDTEVVVALTQADHRPGQRIAFFTDTRRVLSEMKEHHGLIGYAFRFELFGRRAWTISIWRDEVALQRFVRSPTHRAAMRNSEKTAENLRFIRTVMRVDATPPAWTEVISQLAEAEPYGGLRTNADHPGQP